MPKCRRTLFPWSTSRVLLLNKDVLSVKSFISEDKSSTKSLIQIKNKISPRKYLCGTPA